MKDFDPILRAKARLLGDRLSVISSMSFTRKGYCSRKHRTKIPFDSGLVRWNLTPSITGMSDSR